MWELGVGKKIIEHLNVIRFYFNNRFNWIVLINLGFLKLFGSNRLDLRSLIFIVEYRKFLMLNTIYESFKKLIIFIKIVQNHYYIEKKTYI